jgi:hypothetical protein
MAMNVNEGKYKVTFKIEHLEEGTTTREFEIDDDAVWSDHLCNYLDFLGGVYHYSITDKVAVGGLAWGRWTAEQRPTFDRTEGKVYTHSDEGYGDVPGLRRNNQEF